MEFLSEYGMFLAKAVMIVAAVLVMAGGIVALVAPADLETVAREA